MSGVLRSHMKVTALWVPQSCTSGSFTSSGGAPKYNSLSLNFICCSSAGEKDCWLCFGGCIVYYQAESTLCFADTIIQKDGFIIHDGGCSFLISTGVKWKISRGKKKLQIDTLESCFFLSDEIPVFPDNWTQPSHAQARRVLWDNRKPGVQETMTITLLWEPCPMCHLLLWMLPLSPFSAISPCFCA